MKGDKMLQNDLKKLLNKEKNKKKRIKTVTNVIKGVSAIAVTGVAAGILLSPKAGKETREDLNDKAQKKVDDLLEPLKENESMSEKMDEAVKDIKDKTTAIKKDMKKGLKEIDKDVAKTKKKISKEIKK